MKRIRTGPIWVLLVLMILFIIPAKAQAETGTFRTDDYYFTYYCYDAYAEEAEGPV